MTEDTNQNNKVRRWLLAGFGLMGLIIVVVIGFILFGSANPESDDGDGTVINPNVLVYEEGVSSFEILSSDTESITVSSLEGISDSTILCAGVTDQTPEGLLRKIDSIDSLENGYRLNTSPGALTDAIVKCDVSYSITFTEEGTYEIRNTNERVSQYFRFNKLMRMMKP